MLKKIGFLALFLSATAAIQPVTAFAQEHYDRDRDYYAEDHWNGSRRHAHVGMNAGSIVAGVTTTGGNMNFGNMNGQSGATTSAITTHRMVTDTTILAREFRPDCIDRNFAKLRASFIV